MSVNSKYYDSDARTAALDEARSQRDGRDVVAARPLQGGEAVLFSLCRWPTSGSQVKGSY
jgi:hypothetical protein